MFLLLPLQKKNDQVAERMKEDKETEEKQYI